MERLVQMASLWPALEINGERLMKRLMALGDIGTTPGRGVNRLAFSPEDIQARTVVRRWMLAAGMTVRTDAAGNLIGRYEGRFPQAPTLGTGSHLDTVPNAGRYDGAYGVIGGLEVVQTLCDRNLRLDHPIEVIVFADEETTMIGSKAMAGLVSKVEDAALLAHLDRIGGDGARLATAQRPPVSMAAFVELHVEQGPVLESLGVPVGVVIGIVGQRRYEITILGQASHAGTTPMHLRQDALAAAAQMVLTVQAIGTATDDYLTGEQVATVGALTVSPNVANTVPDQVTLSVDMRDLSAASLREMVRRLEQQASAIAARTQTKIQITPKLCNPPVLASSHIQNTITQAWHDWGGYQ